MPEQPKGGRGILEEQVACARETELSACATETPAQAQETQERPQDNHSTEQTGHELQEGDGTIFTANRGQTRGPELDYTVSKSSAH